MRLTQFQGQLLSCAEYSEPTLAKVADKYILFGNAHGDKLRHDVITKTYFVVVEFQATRQSLAWMGVLGMGDIHNAPIIQCTLKIRTQHIRSQVYTVILHCVHRESPETPCIMTSNCLVEMPLPIIRQV
jgi:hypothetical protein